MLRSGSFAGHGGAPEDGYFSLERSGLRCGGCDDFERLDDLNDYMEEYYERRGRRS